MLTIWTLRVVLMLAVVMVTAMMSSPATADDKDKNDDPYKLPPLDAKEWKKQASGLEIWDAKEGKGDEVKKGETVTIHYTGWTLDGNIFDSSRKRGAKATFPLPNLIKGWQEGIPGMKAGGVRRLKIPGNLAYGEKGGAGGKIPPNATLVFEIELFEDPFKLPDLKAKEWEKQPNGIRTWDVVKGTGDEVKPGDTVTIHYTGWTLDGKVFDSSKKGGGKPATFPLGDLIKGWQMMVPGMKVGGIRRMELPHEFAYGERGSPPDIPAKATLVFEIEVKATKK